MNKNMHIEQKSYQTTVMSESVIQVWISKKTKTLSEMQNRPTTTHYSTSSSTN